MIVQSACLAHDIGNPPFGHSGEDAIRYWFEQAAGRGWLDDMSDAEREDFLHFEGNAQGFRVLTQLEYHQFDGGTRLSYATLGTYLKYPWTSRHAEALGYKKHKFGCYQNELPLLEQIAGRLGLPQLEAQRWARHPLVYLMEAADDICYGLIDLEDGLEMELLDYAEVEALLLDLVGDDLPETYRQLGPRDSRRRKLAILRGKAIEHLTNAAAHAFVAQQDRLLAGELSGDLVEHMHGPAQACVLQAKGLRARKSSRTSARRCTRSVPTGRWRSCSRPSAGRRWSSTAAAGCRSRTGGYSICWATAHRTRPGRCTGPSCARSTSSPA